MNCHNLSHSFILYSLIVLTSLNFAIGQTPNGQKGDFTDQFMGTWKGSGTLMGAKTIFNMQWEKVLGEKFMQLTFEHRRKGKDGKEIIFQAQAFYLVKGAGKYEGNWFDSRGIVLPLTSSVKDNALTTIWGNEHTEQGKTVYRLIDQNEMEVQDFVLVNKEWRAFGQATYAREPKMEE